MAGGDDFGGPSNPRAEATANDALNQAETSAGCAATFSYVPPVQTEEELAETEIIIGYLYKEIWAEPKRQCEILEKFKKRTSTFFDEKISLQQVMFLTLYVVAPEDPGGI